MLYKSYFARAFLTDSIENLKEDFEIKQVAIIGYFVFFLSILEILYLE